MYSTRFKDELFANNWLQLVQQPLMKLDQSAKIGVFVYSWCQCIFIRFGATTITSTFLYECVMLFFCYFAYGHRFVCQVMLIIFGLQLCNPSLSTLPYSIQSSFYEWVDIMAGLGSFFNWWDGSLLLNLLQLGFWL